MFDVAVIGSANLDIVVRTERHPRPGETVLGDRYDEYPGGKGLNQAIACARAGATTSFTSCVGHDAAADVLRTVAVDSGVDVTTVEASNLPTGRAAITVDRHGENSIVVVPGANGRVAADSLPEATVAVAQLEIPIEVVDEAFRRAKSVGVITILNPAPAAPLPRSLLESCDIVVPNEHELELIGGVELLHETGVSTVVLTRGAAGVRVFPRGSESWHSEAFEVDPIDTTGAGDAFCGALAAALACGSDLTEAVRYGSAAGALATTVAGAVPSLPLRSAIEGLIAG